MRSEVATDGETWIGDFTASTANAAGVGAVERSGLSRREFGQQRGIPLSTLAWWRQVFRRVGEPVSTALKSGPGTDAVVFTEVPRPVTAPMAPPVLEVLLRNGHVLRVPAGADTDTLQRVLQMLQAAC